MSSFSPAIREFLTTPDNARRLGPYRCKELLDKAGSAPVFKAVEEHAGLSLREVAIKLFDIGGKDRTKNEGDARVVDEARSLCRVQHPNVIRFHTLSTDSKRGLMGLVMEFAEGISVEKQLEDVPRGDDDNAQQRRIALAVEIGINISSALAAAHEAGVVHCNVKPSNIMFTDGTHKLINFGLAASSRATTSTTAEKEKKKTTTTEPAKTPRAGLEVADLAPDSIGRRASTLDKSSADSATAISGTIGYVDPVCLKTTSLPTTSSDLYSLGATLYQCIAGDVPAVATPKHKGLSGVDSKVLVGDAPPASLADVAPSAPAELAKLVDALVSPSREKRPRSADAVLRSLERIRSALAGRERTLPPEERGPFPGLDRYEASDRDVFFGRSPEIAGAIELLRTRGLLGIVGLSGTGKSSITRAGLVPAIEEGALGGWPPKYRSVLVTPGTDLMAALRESLSKVLGVTTLEDHPEAIAEQLAADVDAKGEGIVILVDQLEEIVIKHDSKRDKERLQALDLLSRLAEAPVGLRVIVAVRRDLLDGVLAIDHHFARALSRGIQLLGPLTAAGWGEVLDQGIEAYGYSFHDAELRKEILADLKNRENAMTLVQFGLTRLWATRDQKKKTLTREGYSGKQGKGGMQSALTEHADAAIAGLKLPREKLREVLLAMTTPEGTRAHVELKVLVERFGESAKEAVFALTKARLVVSEAPGFTFVHDSVLRDWRLLRDWVEDARDDRLLVAHIERDAARWNESKDPAELWRKSRLASALDLWKREQGAPFSDPARRFLTKSLRDQAMVRFAFWGLVVLVVTLISGGSLVYAKESRDRAAQAQRDAEALAALKRQADENGMEAAVSAALLADLQKQMAEERATYGKNVQATLKKVADATSLDGAQKATADLKTQNAPGSNQVVPLPVDLSSLNLKATAGSGPKLDTGGPGPSAGAGTFDQSAIERVVSSRKAGVKRTCLERSSSKASTMKVTATLTIAPSGAVQSVTSTGDDPVVGKCIEQQLHTWSFPAPGEVKTVQIPFVFVRQ